VVSQPALFVAGLAAVEKLRSEDPQLVSSCGAAAGLSLGEYTALVFAGAMSFEAGLRVRIGQGPSTVTAAAFSFRQLFGCN
jgi:[acyl-carrier-protein] S-malonyltransferase